jgi:hypothetical protein
MVAELPRLLLRTLPAALLVVACADETSSSVTSFSGGSGLTGLTGAPDTEGATEGTSTGESSDSDDDSGTSAASSDATTTSASASASGGTNPNPDGLPNGSECASDDACMSGNCFTITLPVEGLPAGICGVCDEDQDCVDAGLGIACSIDVPGMQTACTEGGVGSFCDSPEGCKDGLFCDELVDGLGGLLPMACGTCRTDADCLGDARCTPEVDVVGYSGHKYCAEPESIDNDGLCPIDGGDGSCVSGHCAAVDLGFVTVAVCGECSTDGDCGGGTCTPGKFADGFLGSTCT